MQLADHQILVAVVVEMDTHQMEIYKDHQVLVVQVWLYSNIQTPLLSQIQVVDLHLQQTLPVYQDTR